MEPFRFPIFSFPRDGFTTSGWSVGLGWERRLADAWSLYAEYRFNRFAINQRHLSAYSPCQLGLTCTAVTDQSGSFDLQSVRLGINRSFAAWD
jgi:opacity protein-like surface antigen